ncbi:MAG: hypothetical protein HKN75_04425 [Bacteroidia bacterium]|nr:hypothetical protein [Bacteroidia bacterium]
MLPLPAIKILFLVLLCGASYNSFAQLDTTGTAEEYKIKKHSPTKATLLSVVLPGSGQIYNKKYWKAPIVYGGLAAFTIATIDNDDKYQLYRDEYVYRLNNNDSTSNSNLANFPTDVIQSRRDIFRRNRDISIISLSLVYVLQIVDAHVDAHLFEFNVDENLSLNIQPQMMPIQNSLHTGLSLTFTLNK